MAEDEQEPARPASAARDRLSDGCEGPGDLPRGEGDRQRLVSRRPAEEGRDPRAPGAEGAGLRRRRDPSARPAGVGVPPPGVVGGVVLTRLTVKLDHGPTTSIGTAVGSGGMPGPVQLSTARHRYVEGRPSVRTFTALIVKRKPSPAAAANRPAFSPVSAGSGRAPGPSCPSISNCTWVTAVLPGSQPVVSMSHRTVTARSISAAPEGGSMFEIDAASPCRRPPAPPPPQRPPNSPERPGAAVQWSSVAREPPDLPSEGQRRFADHRRSTTRRSGPPTAHAVR